VWHFNQQVQREYPVLCALSSPFQNIRCSLFASHSEDHLTWCIAGLRTT